MPNKTILARACVCFGGLLGAHAPPPPPAGGQSCLRLGQGPGGWGRPTLRSLHCSGLKLPKVQKASGDSGPLGSLDGVREGASTLPSPPLGVFCFEV